MNRVIRITFVILCMVVSSFSIEEIIIEATKIPTPLNFVNSSVEILTEQDLRESGAQFLYDALISLPGVYGTQNGGPGGTSAVYLRGGKPRYTLILLDGVKLNDSQDPNGYDLSSFDISNIQRVEILKGPQSSLYGADAMSGVINIISKKGSGSSSIGLNLEKGSYGSNKFGLNLSEGTESFYFNFGAHIRDTDGFSHTKTVLDDDSFLNKTLDINIGGKTPTNSEWNFSTRAISADAEYDSGSFEKNQLISSTSFKQHLMNEKITSEISSSYRLFKLFYPGTFAFRSKTESFGIGWNNIIKFNDNFTILSGIENNREDFGADYDLDVNSYFLASQFIINDSFNMSLSSRRDNHAVFDTADTIQGSFSLLNKNTRIRGSIGTSYLAPNGFQMSKTDYLEAETGSSYEIGIDHTFENLDLDFDITFFNNSYKQSIEYVPNTDSYTNYSNAKIKGFEIGSNLYPSDISSLRISYTYLDPDADLENIGFLNRKPNHKVNAKYQVSPNEKLTVTSFLSYVDSVSDQDSINYNWPGVKVTLADYTLASINANYKLNKYAQYYLTIMNVLDEEYETIAGYNVPDLSVYTGIRLSF